MSDFYQTFYEEVQAKNDELIRQNVKLKFDLIQLFRLRGQRHVEYQYPLLFRKIRVENTTLYNINIRNYAQVLLNEHGRHIFITWNGGSGSLCGRSGLIFYSGQQNTLSVKSMVKDKAIEIFAKKIIENMRKTLTSSGPVDLGSIDKETVKDKDFDLTFQLKNLKISNLGSFQMKKFKSSSSTNSVDFSIAVPSLKVNSNYDLDGKFRDKTVQGSGNSEIHITGVTVDNGQVVIVESPQEVQIASLNFCYNFKDLKIKQTGLNIEGINPVETTEFLNDAAATYLKNNKKKICDRLCSEIKSRANAKLKGKTRDQLADMMKQ